MHDTLLLRSPQPVCSMHAALFEEGVQMVCVSVCLCEAKLAAPLAQLLIWGGGVVVDEGTRGCRCILPGQLSSA